MVELDDALKPERGVEHQIEVVVDRLVIREGVRQRLMESIEAALKWSEHEVQFLIGQESREEVLTFTTAYANPRTGYLMEKLTPQHFSFNTHVGACPTCEGVGSLMAPDPGLIVPDASLSLKEGAVKSWWARNPKLKALHERGLEALAKHFGISLEAPFKTLPPGFSRRFSMARARKRLPPAGARRATSAASRSPTRGFCTRRNACTTMPRAMPCARS